MEDQAIREQIRRLLDWSDAHRSVDEAVADLRPEFRDKRPANLPFSVWELLEHICIAQQDILQFCTADVYEEKRWPDDYWPDENGVDEVDWNATIETIRANTRQLQQLAMDPRRELTEPVANGDGQTLLRELLLVADHTAYHTGQIILVRKALDAWHPSADK